MEDDLGLHKHMLAELLVERILHLKRDKVVLLHWLDFIAMKPGSHLKEIVAEGLQPQLVEKTGNGMISCSPS